MKPSDKEDKIRLQVFLSRSGVCSRRKAMDLVLEGHVTVNGKVTEEPSTPIDPKKDEVCVDGKEIKETAYQYILFNKPRGYVTTKAEYQFQKTIYDLLPKEFLQLSTAGRLDQDTEGLLLLTNDGDMIFKLTHPKFNIDKTYYAEILGRLGKESKEQLERGVFIENKKTAPAKIKRVKYKDSKTSLYITIHEGRKRQVRYMLAKVGHKVVYLQRTAQGPLQLGTLKAGKWRKLNNKELQALHRV